MSSRHPVLKTKKQIHLFWSILWQSGYSTHLSTSLFLQSYFSNVLSSFYFFHIASSCWAAWINPKRDTKFQSHPQDFYFPTHNTLCLLLLETLISPLFLRPKKVHLTQTHMSNLTPPSLIYNRREHCFPWTPCMTFLYFISTWWIRPAIVTIASYLLCSQYILQEKSTIILMADNWLYLGSNSYW